MLNTNMQISNQKVTGYMPTKFQNLEFAQTCKINHQLEPAASARVYMPET